MHRKVVVVGLNACSCLSQGGWPTLSMDQVVKLWLGECGLVKLLPCWPSHVNMLMSCTHKSQTHTVAVPWVARLHLFQLISVLIRSNNVLIRSSNIWSYPCFACQSWPIGESCNAQDLWPAGGGRVPPHPPPLWRPQVQAGAQCPWGELEYLLLLLLAKLLCKCKG